MMMIGNLVLWVGIPLGWLYIGSRVQTATGSVGAALLATAAGILVSIALMVPALGWLGRKHVEVQAARGLESHAQVALEAIMAITAGVALLAFVIWFLFFSGSSPLPITSPE